MGLKHKFTAELKLAMKQKDKVRLSTLRLINAAVKDMEIARRSTTRDDGPDVNDADILGIMSKMIKQRQESANAYEEGGRLELAEQERAEIEVISEFLPRQLSDAEQAREIDAAIGETGASSLRDMGKVMALLKERHSGRMDFSSVGPKVRAQLG